MKPNCRPYLFYLFIGVLTSSIACKKEHVNNTDQDYPIDLTITKAGRSIMLNWTETNNSTFEKYVIVRSVNHIDDKAEPDSILTTIEDFEINYFKDDTFPVEDSLYYKVYVSIDGRFIYSSTVAVQLLFTFLEFTPRNITFDKENSRMFAWDFNERKIFRYDLENKSQNEFGYTPNFGRYHMEVGYMEQGLELMAVPHGSTSPKIYDPGSLELKEICCEGGLAADITIGNGIFAVADYSGDYSVRLIDRGSLELVNGLTGLQGASRGLKFLPNQPKLINARTELISIYSFDDDWNLLEEKSIALESAQVPFEDIVVSPDGRYFITGNEGHVFDENLNIVGSLNESDDVELRDCAFSNDGSILLAFYSDPNQMIEYSLPELEKKNVTDLPYIPKRCFLNDDGKFFVVGFLEEDEELRALVDEFDYEM